MEIQRRIQRLLAAISLGDEVHGGVRGRSPRSNAGCHLGEPYVVNLDVRDFFPSVRHGLVYRMFRRELGFGRDVASLLTRLTTFRDQLPQGAPTSTIVANLLLAVPVDGPLTARSREIGVRYTRFVDDITLSGSNPKPLINAVARMLSSRRLQIWRKKSKLKITRQSEPQEVTGLMVNSRKGPSISRRRRANIRAAIFQLRNLTDDESRVAAVNSIRGRIAHVRLFNPGAAKRLHRYLESVNDANGAKRRSA